MKGRIVEAQAAGANGLALDLSAELVAVDGIHAVSRDGDARPLVRLGPVPADVALAAGAEVCLWCQRNGTGWQVKVHAVDERGRIGKLVATHRA
ncbi:hypothetical protein BGL_1c25740 [Burkholderia plantarii]|uniref:Uncharacterized protein n=1 Tax=Burkholderia plantarii TaxID=41899 RepID=A0A0B6RUJ0_BURPL|nr:hypothetical protein BGL_1c25740 [Burkholderia plantarii]